MSTHSNTASDHPKDDHDLNAAPPTVTKSGLFRSASAGTEGFGAKGAEGDPKSQVSNGPESYLPVSSYGGGLCGAALALLEGVALNRFTREELRTWIDRHLVHTGFMQRPIRVHEPLFGVMPFDRQCSAFLPEVPPEDETAAILVRARARVIGQLRGLVLTPQDDRFLSAAIFAGRVRRVVSGKTMIWVPRPRSHDALSDVVLSLFIADILRHRQHYATNLCICDTCGRVRFDADPLMRRACPLHLPDPPAESAPRRRSTGAPPTRGKTHDKAARQARQTVLRPSKKAARVAA
jgi:hypothetical protein